MDLLTLEDFLEEAPNHEQKHTLIKKWLDEQHQSIFDAFDRNAPILELLEQRSSLIDQLLCGLWNQMEWPTFPSISLIAVGGYGRGELFPHSDIDLLLLREPGDIEPLKPAIEHFISQLWDLGLKIGHAVRTLDECVKQAENDLTIATNLMESRMLAGPRRLLDALQQRTGTEALWPSIDFYHAKLIEQRQRHRKHHDTEYYLEPNIKEAPGGLRDIQTITWVAQRELGIQNLEDLAQQGLINQEELHQIVKGHAFISRVRFALHLLTKRDENRLLFDYQKSIAKILGYTETTGNLAVERFMQDYYRHALAISESNTLMLQLLDETYFQNPDTADLQPINDHFQLRDGMIEVLNPYIFSRNPSTLLDVFVIMGNNANIQGVRASTIRLMRKHRHLIDEHFRAQPENTTRFMEIIRAPYRLFTQLKRMKRYGILSRYLPAFGEIIGKMQYDLFHIYTVDAHTLLVIQNMRRFRHKNAKESFPIAANIIHFLPKVELLYLAGLFHDMAKGRGGDHSKLGAVDAQTFCLKHSLSNWDAHLVSWLVENHLLMSITAQKQDISDPEVIQNFASIVGDQIHLDYLYVLTIADICATNPTLWNSWRASLLAQLYTETRRLLRRGVDKALNKQEQIQATQTTTQKLLNNRGFEHADISQLWSKLGEEYFLRDTPEDIAWHTQAILQRGIHQTKPLILIGNVNKKRFRTGKQIFVYTPDKPNLFAATVTVLDQLNLSIQDARIITSNNGYSLDTYVVFDSNNPQDELQDPERLSHIETALQAALSSPEDYTQILNKRLPRQLKYFEVPTEVNISNDISNMRTIIEIRALDHPGLLALIGKIFADHGILVENAKIVTLGDCAEDVFFVVDTHHNPLSDPKLCKKLSETIKHQIDQKS